MNISTKMRLAATAAVAISLVSFGSAHADTSTITNTGPNSTNLVTVSNVVNRTVTNVNTTTVTNTNSQTGTSGNATSNNNTTGGGAGSGGVGAQSGNVTNTNSFATAISIANGTAVTPSNIAGGGGGGVAPESATSSAATLPRTGGDGVDTSLMNALYNAPKGVFGPMPRTGASATLLLTALAAALAVGSAVVYDKYKQAKTLVGTEA